MGLILNAHREARKDPREGEGKRPEGVRGHWTAGLQTGGNSWGLKG